MMTFPIALSACFLRTSAAFVVSKKCGATTSRCCASRLASNKNSAFIETGVSRLGTLQTLLTQHGVPGSKGCTKGGGDVVPMASPLHDDETPELLSSMGGGGRGGVERGQQQVLMDDVHPYLLPLAKSSSTGNLICAYRPPSIQDETTSSVTPWPIVETTIGAPGMQLLALNSEHLMRRIVCEMDSSTNEADNDGTNATHALIQLYNEGLGRGTLGPNNKLLDTPYERGSVDKLGYGVDKYVLLRVGPFPDLYQKMSMEHLGRGDEQSALIAAESANGKLSGFGSMYRFYARTLAQLPMNRNEEARDAARMCLRLPLPTIGMNYEDYQEVALLGQLLVTDGEDSTTDDALLKIREMRDVMKSVEEKDPQKADKSREQLIVEQADDMIADTLLSKQKWSTVRPKLADLFRSAGREELATFVDLKQ